MDMLHTVQERGACIDAPFYKEEHSKATLWCQNIPDVLWSREVLCKNYRVGTVA